MRPRAHVFRLASSPPAFSIRVSRLRVTLIQQPLVWGEPAANRARFAALLEPLAGSTDLVVLPETFTTGFSMEVELRAGNSCRQALRRAAGQLAT